MKQKLLLGLFLFGIPLLGWAVSSWVLSNIDSQMRAAIAKVHPEADKERLESLTAREVCIQNEAIDDEFCSSVGHVALWRSSSVATAAVAALFLGFIGIGGRLSRNNRKTLVAMFKPGLYATLAVVALLIVANASIALATIYYGESALIDRVHVGLMIAIGLGAGSGVYAVLRGISAFLRREKVVSLGMAVTRAEEPGLWNLVEETARTVGTACPDNLVLGVDGGVFVTEAEVSTISGEVSGRTLHCSLGLCHLLSRRELVAVLSHELGHFKGEDTRFGVEFSPIYRSTATTLHGLSMAGGGGTGQLALLPALVLMDHFFQSFAQAESEISRERELEADRVAVQAVDAPTFGRALVKACLYSGPLEEHCGAAVTRLRNRESEENLFLPGLDDCRKVSEQATFESIAGKEVIHPLDSHPPLSVRLESLGLDAQATFESARTIGDSTDSAVSVLRDADSFERKATQEFESWVRLRLDLAA